MWVLLFAAAIVGASTFLLPQVEGYGTVWQQAVLLGAYSIVSALTSSSFAESHRSVVLIMAFVLNVIAFLLPGALLWVVLAKRSPRLAQTACAVWCVTYLCLLFILFPAHDGP